ncbi:MAG TPA: response regulator transcription factor [Propionibacterium sp.]|nr:response regulator transcription factor [Propionibacterium sp.]
MAQRVLVVDDERPIRTMLRAYLVDGGHEVIEAALGSEALRKLAASPVDLVLLDIGLPDIGGLEVLATIRQTSDVPVILVTARAEELDKLTGLEAGADDYVTKPFSPREVVARVNTVLRRSARQGTHPPLDPVVTIAELVIDPRTRTVDLAGRPVALTALEFDLVHALASDPGRVFSRVQLLESVWGYDFYGDERVVDVHIRRIRAALGDDAADPRLIGTVRGVGYRLLVGEA